MYEDEERLIQHKCLWITEEVYKIAKREKKRLWFEEKRKVSIAKLINNAVLKTYGCNNLSSLPAGNISEH